MDDFTNVIKRYSKVQIKIKDMLDRYNTLPLKCQSKIGYDTLIQNVIRKEIISLMSIIIASIDIDLKMKNNRKKYSEKKLLWLFIFIQYKWLFYI